MSAREERPGRAGQLAMDALRWQSAGDPHAPESIAALSTQDQVALARAAHRVVRACDDAAERAAGRRED